MKATGVQLYASFLLICTTVCQIYQPPASQHSKASVPDIFPQEQISKWHSRHEVTQCL